MRVRVLPHSLHATPFSVWTIAEKPQQMKGQSDVISSLNVAIDALNITKVSSIALANAAFSSTSDLLTLIRVHLLPVHGQSFAEVYRAR